MGVHIAVKVAVHGALDRRGLVMVLVRVQNLLNALELLLSGALLLRQAGVLLQLLVQLLAGGLEQVRSRLQQRAGARGQAVLIVLQARALLDAPRRFEGQVAREVQVARTAGEVVTVSRQHGALAADGPGVGRHVGLMLQQIDVPGVVQVDLRVVLMGALQSAYRLEGALQGLQAAR